MNQLRTTARSLFDIGVQAADPTKAVLAELATTPLQPCPAGRQIIIAFGKAAVAMTRAALTCLPDGAEYQAIVVTNYENAVEIPGCRVIAAGHPVPDENGLKAGQLVREILGTTTAQDQVLCLISGGGSALLPAPAEGLTLADKSAVNTLLLASGCDIEQVNLVRQHLSALKGGRLAALAAPAPVRSLIVSDVIGDNPSAIASGPTAAPLGSRDDAVKQLKDKNIWDSLPPAVIAHLSEPDSTTQSESNLANNTIICSNRQSLEAIAAATPDLNPLIISSTLDGDVEQVAQDLMQQAKDSLNTPNRLLIWGGETTVTLTGTGKGGRNQELALRFAQAANDLPGDWVFLSGGTDGRDGPTDAAGGIVDSAIAKHSTTAQITALLDNNDSYQGLTTLDALLMTGATGTNVADIQIFLRL